MHSASFLTKLKKKPELKDNPHLAAMIEAHKATKRLENRQGLTPEAKKEALDTEYQKFAAASSALMDTPSDRAAFSSVAARVTPHFKEMTAESTKPAPPYKQWEPTPEFYAQCNARWDLVKGNPERIKLSSDFCRLCTKFLETKNGGKPNEQGFEHYKEYDQLNPSEKKELGEIAAESGKKWQELKEKFGGILPKEYQKEFDQDQKMFTDCHFAEEFKTHKAKENYPAATREVSNANTAKEATSVAALLQPLQTPAVAKSASTGPTPS